MKVLRKSLKTWAKTLSNLKEDISDANALIAMFNAIENSRSLTSSEFDLRKHIKDHLTKLLQQQNILAV